MTLTVPTLTGTGAPINSIGASTLVSVVANGTTNPGASSTSVSVSTSADTAAASGAAFTIGVPAALVASGGNGQSVPVGTAFPTHLGASLKDASVPPVAVDQPGVPVVFTAVAAADGASGTFAGVPTSTVTVATGNTGVATAPPLTANSIAGTFTVTATTGSLNASFTETNLTPRVALLRQ